MAARPDSGERMNETADVEPALRKLKHGESGGADQWPTQKTPRVSHIIANLILSGVSLIMSLRGQANTPFSMGCSLLTVAIDDFHDASMSAIGIGILGDLFPVLDFLMGNNVIIATNIASLVPHLRQLLPVVASNSPNTFS